MYHLRADTECLYVKRENGGRKWIQQELTSKTIITILKKDLDATIGRMLQLINTHEKKKNSMRTSKQ